MEENDKYFCSIMIEFNIKWFIRSKEKRLNKLQKSIAS